MAYADLILLGRVFRGLHDGWAEALAIHGGRIVASGRRDAVLALAGPGTRRVELDGRVAVPAFNDAHQHLLPLGLGMAQVNLRAEEVRTLDELLARMRRAASDAPPGAWVVGRGYDHNELDVGRHPTAEELSAAVPDRPAYVRRTCGHMLVANHAAMALAEVGHNTPDPEGGALGRRDGRLTGLFQERAMRLIQEREPPPSDAQLRDAVECAGRHMLGHGVTAVMDANVGMVAGMREVAAYREVLEGGRLPVRVWGCLAGSPEGIAAEAWEAGLRPAAPLATDAPEQDDMLRFGATKVFADGSAGGLTAAMSMPYEQGGTGIFCLPDARMHEYLLRYHRQGWQLAIHAIGDAAIEQVLSGMEAADTDERPVAGRRHRIEHCGFLSPAQMARMAARGIEPVPQPVFMYEFGDLYVTNLGRERAEAAYPMRSWLDAGQNPAASSDAPVSTTDPFRNLYAMTTRRTNRGTVLGAAEAISMEQAVHCLTWCGAYTQFAEARRGRLLPGMAADVAVLSRDVCAEPDSVLDTRADLVLRGGVAVVDRNEELPAPKHHLRHAPA